MIAVTAYSESFTTREQHEATLIASNLGIQHIFLPANEFNNPKFIANTPERCYFCKRERFIALINWAKLHNYDWVIEGTNADDLGDYRPGMQAISELSGVTSPLLSAGFTKTEIRAISKEWGLPTWDKPSAACLVSRLNYGLEITPARLAQVEQAEELLRQFCSRQLRVRHHGDLARIEVSAEDIQAIAVPEVSRVINLGLQKLGFLYVTLDLLGYRTGSMNEILHKEHKNEYQ